VKEKEEEEFFLQKKAEWDAYDEKEESKYIQQRLSVHTLAKEREEQLKEKRARLEKVEKVSSTFGGEGGVECFFHER
jgi:hypothetical protein